MDGLCDAVYGAKKRRKPASDASDQGEDEFCSTKEEPKPEAWALTGKQNDQSGVLCCFGCSGHLFQNRGRPIHIGDTENQYRLIGARLQTTINVVDVDVGFAESRSSAG